MKHRYYLFRWNPDVASIKAQRDNGVSRRKIWVDYLDAVVLKVPHVEPEPEEVTLRRVKNIGKWYRENALRRAEQRATMKEYEPVSKWVSDNKVSTAHTHLDFHDGKVMVLGSMVNGPMKKVPNVNVDVIDLT